MSTTTSSHAGIGHVTRAVGAATLLSLTVAIAPAQAAASWPTTATIVTTWRNTQQSVAAVEVRSERTKHAGVGWFKLQSTGDYTFNCNAVRGIEYGTLSGSRLVATRTVAVSQLYCDGLVITGRIGGTRTGRVYALTTTTDPVQRVGAKSISGSAEVNGSHRAVSGRLSKTEESSRSQVSFPAASTKAPSHLTWSAEFGSDTAHDLAGWQVSDETTFGAADGSTNVMRDSTSNVRVEDHRLRIQSHRVASTRSSLGQPFSSGYLTSGYVLNLSKPGRLDAKIKPNLTPGKSKGKWPGLWLRNRDLQELDITEMIGTSQATAARSNQFRVTAHVDTTSKDPRHVGYLHSYAGTSNQFHLWRTTWDGKGNITITCDGVRVAAFRTSQTPWMSTFTGDFQIRLQQFMQGRMPGAVDKNTTFGDSFEVGYLRYYT